MSAMKVTSYKSDFNRDVNSACERNMLRNRPHQFPSMRKGEGVYCENKVSGRIGGGAKKKGCCI